MRQIKEIKKAASSVGQTPEQWVAGHNNEGIDPVQNARACNSCRDELAGIIRRAISADIVCGICGSGVDESRTCYGCGANV